MTLPTNIASRISTTGEAGTDQIDEIGLIDQEHQDVLNKTMAPTASRRFLESSHTTQRSTNSTDEIDECGNSIPMSFETNDPASADRAIAALEGIFTGATPLMSDGMALDASSLCRMNYTLTYVYGTKPLYDDSAMPTHKPKLLSNKTLFIIAGSGGGALLIAIIATLVARVWVAKKRRALKTSKVTVATEVTE